MILNVTYVNANRIPGLIDESLLTLDRVINALVDNSENGYWGGTKLTRLLHDFPRRGGEDVHRCWQA